MLFWTFKLRNVTGDIVEKREITLSVYIFSVVEILLVVFWHDRWLPTRHHLHRSSHPRCSLDADGGAGAIFRQKGLPGADWSRREKATQLRTSRQKPRRPCLEATRNAEPCRDPPPSIRRHPNGLSACTAGKQPVGLSTNKWYFQWVVGGRQHALRPQRIYHFGRVSLTSAAVDGGRGRRVGCWTWTVTWLPNTESQRRPQRHTRRSASAISFWDESLRWSVYQGRELRPCGYRPSSKDVQFCSRKSVSRQRLTHEDTHTHTHTHTRTFKVRTKFP